jgi:hypothetical protein
VNFLPHCIFQSGNVGKWSCVAPTCSYRGGREKWWLEGYSGESSFHIYIIIINYLRLSSLVPTTATFVCLTAQGGSDLNDASDGLSQY